MLPGAVASFVVGWFCAKAVGIDTRSNAAPKINAFISGLLQFASVALLVGAIGKIAAPLADLIRRDRRSGPTPRIADVGEHGGDLSVVELPGEGRHCRRRRF